MPGVNDHSNVAGRIDTPRHSDVPLQQPSQRTSLASQELVWGLYRPPSSGGATRYAGTRSGSTEGPPCAVSISQCRRDLIRGSLRNTMILYRIERK